MKKYSNFITRILLISLCTGMLICCVAACKKKQVGTTGKSQEVGSFAILGSVPNDAVGYAVFDTTSDAYKRLKASVWGSTYQSPFSSNVLDKLTPDVKALVESLKHAGINLFDPQSLEKTIVRAVIYAAPGQGVSPIGIKAVLGLNVANSVKVQELVTMLRQQIQQRSGNTQDFDNGGFSFDTGDIQKGNIPQGGQATIPHPKVFVAFKDQTIVMSLDPESAKGFISGQTGSGPEIIRSSLYTQSTAGFAPTNERCSEIYVDIAKLTQAIKASMGDGALPMDISSIPLQSFAYTTSMSNSPKSDLRVVYDNKNPIVANVSAALKGSSSQQVAASIPQNVALFLSLDGQSLRGLKDMALTSGGIPPQAGAMLGMLDGVKRLGIGVLAPTQSLGMMTIPDLVLLAEADNAATIKGQLKMMIGPMLGQMMGGKANWQTKQIDGVNVDSIMTPMMVGAFLADSNSFVAISTQESLMQTAIAGLKTPSNTFVKNIDAKIDTAVVTKPSIVNMVINCDQMGSLVEKLSGLLQSFAAQSPQMQQILDPKQLAQFRKMGIFASTIQNEQNSIFASFMCVSDPTASVASKAGNIAG